MQEGCIESGAGYLVLSSLCCFLFLVVNSEKNRSRFLWKYQRVYVFLFALKATMGTCQFEEAAVRYNLHNSIQFGVVRLYVVR